MERLGVQGGMSEGYVMIRVTDEHGNWAQRVVARELFDAAAEGQQIIWLAIRELVDAVEKAGEDGYEEVE
jgi:hypothetical protein